MASLTLAQAQQIIAQNQMASGAALGGIGALLLGSRGGRGLVGDTAALGGLAFSQVVTLYITPVVYTYMDERQKRLRRKRRSLGAADPTPTIDLQKEQPSLIAGPAQ